MNTFVAILRGINVSGKNKIKMADLKECLSQIGFSKIETYIQSGNIIFDTPKNNKQDIAESIHQKIKDTYTFNVPVIVLTQKELTDIAQKNPYHNTDSDLSKLHITFLKNEAEIEKIENLNQTSYSPDTFSMGNKAIYLHCPNGYGRTKLTNTFFENKLKVTATTRNLKTVNALIELIKSRIPTT